MADQPKKKPLANKSINQDRPNHKANKQQADGQFRGKAEYRGSHTRKSPQTGVQKVLLGGGALRNIQRLHEGSTKGQWSLPTGVGTPYDARQVEENRRLYPHLFTDDKKPRASSGRK